MSNKQPIEQEECKEYKEIKQQLLEETKYLAKLMKNYYNNPNNQWKFEKLRRPDMLYWGGKVERIRDDNKYRGRYNEMENNMIWIRDQEYEEIRYTQRRIQTLKLQLKSVGVWEQIKGKVNFSNKDIERFVGNVMQRNDEEEYEEDEE